MVLEKLSLKESKLNKDERLDDLQFAGLKIIQNKKLYCFSSDAVLLCNFVKAKKTDTIIDLCSGSGIVGILAQAKTGAKTLIMIEKQQALCDMCKRTLELNNLNNANVINIDVKDAPKILGTEFADVVCANPPYFLPTQKKLTGNIDIDMAKFEITTNIDELCFVASKLLKYGGKFYMINDSCRTAEIISVLKKYNMEPKILEFVFPKKDKDSNVVLIQATKGGKCQSKVYFRTLY